MTETWRKLEQLVARIQQQLTPDADVIHDAKIMGRNSGRRRQIDVLVRQQVGQYEIQIAIECKDTKSKVGAPDVEAFVGKLDDVGVQKGVMVCPHGFSAPAKKTALAKRIDLYSPVDTEPHKWQVNPTIPAICDFRSASMAFNISSNHPSPFCLPGDFCSECVAYDKEGNELGTMLDAAISKWNDGHFPTEPGEYNLPVFDTLEVMTDNGYGMSVPMGMSVNLFVEQQLYYGEVSIREISGFKDQFSGSVITNAFTFGILDPEEVMGTWQKIAHKNEAPFKPGLTLSGLLAWAKG